MPTFSISVNSHRIDKNNYPTEKEALSRALECARVLHRGVSVYRVDEAGTDAQARNWPKVEKPITHIAFVSPDGTVRAGEHPAIELLEKNPEKGEYKTFPYAIGKLNNLLKRLDTTAKNIEVKASGLSEKIFNVADEVQAIINGGDLNDTNLGNLPKLESSKSPKAEAKATKPNPTNTLFGFFKPGTLFVKDANTSINVIAYADGIVSFTTSIPNVQTTYQGNSVALTQTFPAKVYRAKASAFSRVLLKNGFVPLKADAAKNPKSAKAYDEPRPYLQPAVKSREADEKLMMQDKYKQVLQTTDKPKTLLGFCMDLCGNDIEASDELAQACLDTFSNRNNSTSVAELKAMSSFRGNKLPVGWFDTAKVAATQQIKASQEPANKLRGYYPSVEVQRAAASALKSAENQGVRFPRATKIHAQRLAKGEPLSHASAERMHLFLTRSTKTSALQYTAWGGTAGLNWIKAVYEKPTRTADGFVTQTPEAKI